MQQTPIKHIKKCLDNDLAILIFYQSPIAMLILGEDATILNANLAFFEMTGYEEIELLGKHISYFKSNQNKNSFYVTSYWDSMQASYSKSMEVYVQCKNNTHILLCNKNNTIMDRGTPYVILTFENITEQKRMLKHYQHLAMHDSLTGLANRVLLENTFKMAKNRALKSDQKMALIICDINEFKQYNDRYGHDFGDSVLRTVSKTLKNLLRINDMVARYGGDEFVLIFEDITHRDEIAYIESKIKSAFPLVITQGEQSCQINMSIGSSCFPDEGNTFNDLIQVADKNMYKEKKDFYALR